MKCKDCKFWTENKEDGFGTCSSGKFEYNNCYRLIDADTDKLIYKDGDGYNAEPSTGPDFGCIHFQNKEQ